MKEQYICKFCSKKFEDYKCNGRSFCSKKCSDLYFGLKMKKICKQCGKKYKSSPSQNAKFCSHKCKGLYKHLHNSVKRECKVCGKIFYVAKSNLIRGYGIYCSQKCNGIGRTIRTKKACLFCGKQYEVRNSNKKKFCSQKCGALYKHFHQSETRKCKLCGKEFYIALSGIKNGGGVYCSRKCHTQCPEWKARQKSQLLINLKKLKENYQPNKSEVKLENTIKELNLSYKFIGNGDVWIAGLNPDFINTNGQKKIIELFGEPWHKDGFIKNRKISYCSTEVGRKKIFSEYGYETLIIWTNELKNINAVEKKIIDFNRGIK